MAPALRRPCGHLLPSNPSASTLLAIVAASALLGAACDQQPKSGAAGREQTTAAETAAADNPSGSPQEGTETAPAPPDDSGASPEETNPPAGKATTADDGRAGTAGDAKPVVGKEQSTDAYGAWLQSSGRYVAGKAATVQAVLVAKGNFKCNEKYPYKFKLGSPSPGVTYPQTTVRGISYGKKRSTLSIPFTPSKAGPATISGTFYVSVCDPSKCKIGKQKLSVTVTVEES